MELIIRKYPNREMLTGFTGLLLILIVASILGSTVGFLDAYPKDHYDYILQDAIVDYYFKPIFWIIIFGFIPALITGIPLGVFIRKSIKKLI